MRKALLLGLLLITSSAHATDQESDPVTWRGETFYPETGPAMMWNASPNTPRRLFDADSTANYKGYHAKWEIKDDQLYLIDFQAREHGKKVGLRQLFPGAHAPILATWFSNTIIVPHGEAVGRYQGSGRVVFTRELYLKFKQGRMVKREEKVFDPKKTPVSEG